MVGNLLTAFGHGLRETRLTAALGYLIALRPDAFESLLNMAEGITSVELEHQHGVDGRSDVLLHSPHEKVIIEAKVGATNPRRQAARYPGTRRVLLTAYRPSPKEQKSKTIQYLTWGQLVPTLNSLSKDPNGEVKTLSIGMIRYMEEHGMIRREEPVEIYAREINEENTLLMFMEAGLYLCDYSRNSRLPEALYFAPHFGARIARDYPGIHLGISYVARIEKVEVVEQWADIQAALIDHRGKAWFKKHHDIFKRVKWLREHKKRSLVIMSLPQLVFHPPVRKESLQEGKGWLSRRFLSFQELFEARTK